MNIHAHDWLAKSVPSRPYPLPSAAANDSRVHRWHYVSVRFKFALTLLLAIGWGVASYALSRSWIQPLSIAMGDVGAHLLVLGIATLPGCMNVFLMVGLLMDRRPPRACFADHHFPGITLLIAAYNEQDSILDTLASIDAQEYPASLEVLVVNDGSTDETMARLRSASYPWLQIIDLKCNGGKAKALNVGLRYASYPLTVTLDADSCLFRNALRRLVERYLSDPPNTAAVAGAVLVRNSRRNPLTRMQEWDYFLGMSAVKRLQSMFQGTLVAQGAFSLYRTDILRAVGGWPDSVGEDIVLTWAILRDGHRVGYGEDAIAFTNAPETLGQFLRQRQRWTRGLLEAFQVHGHLLFHRRLSTLFIWWNLLFPYIDMVYALAFLPGVVLACFGIYWLAGPMTLLALPPAVLVSYQVYLIQSRMFREQGLTVRHNALGVVLYLLFYGVVVKPGCLMGYAAEALNLRKRWGTK